MPPARGGAEAVEDRLFRALAVLRAVMLLNAVGMALYGADDFQRPVLAAVCVAGMVLWTAVATAAYAVPRHRRAWLLVADLAVAEALLVLTPWAKGEGFSATVPGFWIAASLLAWAVHWRWIGGLVAAALLAATDVAIRQELTQSIYGNVLLILVGGPVVGYMCESLQRMATERDAAERAAATAAERARLARAVHDGVLQVLALVQRRGRELGGDAAELGRLAGEQEAALRRLIRAQDATSAERASGTVDLVRELAALERRGNVTFSGPAGPVPLPAPVATELVAAVGACLDNVERHVGPGAPAWVFLEALADRVEVSVRDEGPGIPEGRLAAAEADGRLGVSESVRGRLADLGGTAELSTGSFGTEWVLTVPLEGTG
ncbi:MacS family sensor histidine kinase [Nocardioides ferulae]|uniref:MacS family sensor histidine kinase n=1 Tax=Nocardioides ferulae TaxID=2340821 RepID=UPI000EB38653|nr:DUF5931 domain-containing protein [Nocardioides ferulae]